MMIHHQETAVVLVSNRVAILLLQKHIWGMDGW